MNSVRCIHLRSHFLVNHAVFEAKVILNVVQFEKIILFCCELAELQSQCPDQAVSQPQEGEGSLGTVQGWTREEPWRGQKVVGASETQLECVVA